MVGDRDLLFRLINELLEYEKANAGVLDLELEEVNLKDVVAAAIEDVADLASRKKLTLNWQLVSDVYVLADAPKLGRVMVNLVSNATKFSPPGSTVQINATENKKFVELNIIDQGPGIAAEYQQLVFERYERLTGEGSAIEGTGLGLA